MNRPARREVGRALAFTIAGRLADARDSLRRLRAFDDRQRWIARRDDDASQLPLPIEGGGALGLGPSSGGTNAGPDEPDRGRGKEFNTLRSAGHGRRNAE